MKFLAEEVATENTIKSFEDITWSDIWAKIVNWCLNQGIRLIIGIVLLIIVFKIINAVTKRINRKLTEKNADKTASIVFVRFMRIALKIVFFGVFLSFIGIDSAAIGALVTSIGLAIGLALQGGLSNFAGGVILLIMRPFKIDDFIEAQNVLGTVEDIHLFYTYVRTPDNRVAMIPNGSLANGNIINYSQKDLRRIDLIVPISYDSDFYQAQQAILSVLDEHPGVELKPAPTVRLSEYGESSMNLVVRAWCKNADYWNVRFDLLELIKLSFNEKGIQIPYNKLDVFVKQAGNSKGEK